MVCWKPATDLLSFIYIARQYHGSVCKVPAAVNPTQTITTTTISQTLADSLNAGLTAGYLSV